MNSLFFLCLILSLIDPAEIHLKWFKVGYCARLQIGVCETYIALVLLCLTDYVAYNFLPVDILKLVFKMQAQFLAGLQ